MTKEKTVTLAEVRPAIEYAIRTANPAMEEIDIEQLVYHTIAELTSPAVEFQEGELYRYTRSTDPAGYFQHTGRNVDTYDIRKLSTIEAGATKIIEALDLAYNALCHGPKKQLILSALDKWRGERNES